MAKVKQFKLYFRKSSFKKDIFNANKFLELILYYKPKNFLEVGVLEGVTARNVCEILCKAHLNSFTYTGIDLFGIDQIENNVKEFTPITNKFSNPFKYIYFKYILKLNPNSAEAVNHLLKKFNKSVEIHKGYSHLVLKKLDISKYDFVFLDGGHSYETVKEDLNIILKKIKKNSIILCDDYNMLNYGIKKAVNEIKNDYYFEDLGRFALIRT